MSSLKETVCENCKHSLSENDTRYNTRKKLSENYSLYWTGLKKNYLEIRKYKCPNCKKTNIFKKKTNTYLYK